MILPDLFLPSRANQIADYSGMDSIDCCFDKKHFKAYPHRVQYTYNSRGFRDTEWPEQFCQVLWCIGDSFTVGLGSPVQHSWPAVLQRRTGRRCINISMDGASNNWISKTAQAILLQFPAADIVVHWSFLNRRELDIDQALQRKFYFFYKSVRDSDWPDCKINEFDQLPMYIQKELVQMHGWNSKVFSDDRRVHYVRSDLEQDIINTKKCIERLPKNVVHSHIPNWAPPNTNIDINNMISIDQVDFARDGFHYDIKTSELLVDKIMSVLACNASDQALS